MEKAVQMDPTDPEKHFTLGLYYDKKGWQDLAVSEYEEALYLDPQYLYNRLRSKERAAEGPVEPEH
jgi:Tfp pilus assembly protein PilF